MSNVTKRTFRSVMNMALFMMVCMAIILVYGTWPRKKEVVYEVVPVVGPGYDVMKGFYPEEEHLHQLGNNNARKPGSEVLEKALDLIVEMENAQRDPEAVGDVHLKHKAYGLYQIRQPYLDDVNRIVGTKRMMETWGVKELVIGDVKDEEKARWAAKEYLKYYGERYWKITGKIPDEEVYGRIHNGGPDGWKKQRTSKYGRKLAVLACAI